MPEPSTPKILYLKYTREEAIELTGIRALHPKGDMSIQDHVTPYEELRENSLVPGKFVVTITRSIYFRSMQIIIDFENLTILNSFILSSGYKERVSSICLINQVDHAIRKGFKYIELDAHRNRVPINWQGTLIPWTGYRIWGRYGFMMLRDTDNLNFINLMHSNNHIQILQIHQLYEKSGDSTIDEKNERAKELWKLDGFSWWGRFSLNYLSNSYMILKKCLTD